MKAIATDLRSAAVVSFVLVLPLLILQSANTTLTRQNAPGLIVLFSLLWLIPVAFLVVAMSIVRNVRAGKSIAGSPSKFVLSAAFVLVLVVMWGSLVADQLPCFLGIPNCD